LPVGLQDEALKHERCFRPWSVELGDEGPEGQFIDRDFPEFHTDALLSGQENGIFASTGSISKHGLIAGK
jgi:hypothetical protein